MTPDGKQAPKHLDRPTRKWWAAVVQQYELEPHHKRLLTAACEAWDRAQAARLELDAHYERTGKLTIETGAGMIRPHPASKLEMDYRSLFAKLVRELGLDLGTPSEALTEKPRTQPRPAFGESR